MVYELTFLTLAQNSSGVLERCLRSCKDLGHLLVVDGGSSDDTKSIADRQGARVVHRSFDYAAAQYNFGLSLVQTKWCFILDSDEYLSEELKQELSRLSELPEITAFDVPRLNSFVGVPIRHSGWWPDYNSRLVNVQESRYDDRRVHARIVTSGQVERLHGHINHETYVSVFQYVEKLNKFTDREVYARTRPQVVSDRRSRFRKIWLRTPFKPFSKFVYMYIVRQGFRDGRSGFRLAVLSSFYEYVAGLKVKYDAEAEKRER